MSVQDDVVRVAQVDAEPLLLDTAEDLAPWVKVSPHTIRSWARRGYIRRFPGDRYHGMDVVEYLEKRTDLNARKARRLRNST